MNKQRRDMVRALCKNGGAVSLVAVPAVWTRPVVEAVFLPAHAQTTSCGQILSLSQLTVSCGDSTVDEITALYVDESGPCPILAQRSEGAGAEGLLTAVVRFPGAIFELTVALQRLDDSGSIDTSVGYDARLVGEDTCPDVDPLLNTTAEDSFQITGSAGGVYNVTATSNVDVSTSTVSIADILLTRVE